MLFSSSIGEGVLLLSFISYRNPDKYVCYLNPENYPAEDRPRSNFWSTSIQCLGKREKNINRPVTVFVTVNIIYSSSLISVISEQYYLNEENL